MESSALIRRHIVVHTGIGDPQLRRHILHARSPPKPLTANTAKAASQTWSRVNPTLDGTLATVERDDFQTVAARVVECDRVPVNPPVQQHKRR